MLEYAIRDYGFRPHRHGRVRPRPTPESIDELLRDAGFTAVTVEIIGYEATVEQHQAWLSIPIFSGRFAALSYDERMDILEKAYRRVDKGQVSTTRWLVVTA